MRYLLLVIALFLMVIALFLAGCASFRVPADYVPEVPIVSASTRSMYDNLTVVVTTGDLPPRAVDQASGVIVTFSSGFLLGTGQWQNELPLDRAAQLCMLPILRMDGILPQSNPEEMSRRSRLIEDCAWTLIRLHAGVLRPKVGE